ncbi:carbohydrate ABC transporter permease [Paenibacillus chitinolyticus]|uniref:carbohydrate ABC transporter permease n=1 Tax=Paenibacillus chitinolyticus TaxID=79263 RepID=UPI0026E50263|nr:sugar ABC transporter permease [Paenibacillus chitinolyticus]GKS10314.1 ABC transporter permease [Paenibacillus chitinolyticus]
MNKVYRNPLAYLVFIIPTLFFYLTFYMFPLLTTFRYGFTSWDGLTAPVFNGLDNFKEAFNDKNFWISVKNNLYFILFSVFIQVPVIVIFSVLISEVRKLRGFYKTTVFLPSILSTAVVGVLWTVVVFDPTVGLLNKLLESIGLDKLIHLWLADETTAMLSILLTNAWQWTGFYIVLVLAAIFGISKEVYEAAEIDGATGFQRALLITVPLIRPILAVIVLLSITGAMKAMDIVMVMTKGGPYGSTEVMASYMYKVGMTTGNYGYANTIAILIFVFTLIITLISNLLTKKLEDVEN